MEAMNKLPEDYERMGVDYEKFRKYLLGRHSVQG